jgi:hypothetical protein
LNDLISSRITKIKIERYGFVIDQTRKEGKKEKDYNVIISLISKNRRGKNQGVLLSLSPKYKRIIDEGIKKT